MSKIIIQPDAKALTGLLAGPDGEIDLDLRQSIVEEFAKRHLKSVVTEPAFQQVVKTLTEKIIGLIQLQIGTVKREYVNGSYGNYIHLKPEFADAIKDEVERTARRTVDALVFDVLDAKIVALTEAAMARAEATMEKRLDAAVEQLIKTRVQARLNAIQASLAESGL